MRITNKIMQRNNLSNINTNKIYRDRLSSQMSSQKKINRPSDDPVVAIRALRLRSNVTEITQYYTKNIPDAESWLKVTEDAISNLSQVITTMIARCNKGANDELTTANRQIILEEMKKLAEEVYSTGNADYAGRYVFTGYRTDTPLSFMEAKTQNYTITEQLDKNAIDSVSKVETDKLLDINSSNYKDIDVDEDDISSAEVHRIRLAYKDCADYTAYETVRTQQNELKGKLEEYAPYLKAVGLDWDNLDFNHLSETDLDNITKAIEEVNKKAQDAQGGIIIRANGGATGRDSEVGGDGSIAVGWEYLDLKELEDLKEWSNEWKETQEGMEGLASPTIEFTGPDGKTNVWTGFVGGAPIGAAGKADDTVIETGVITLMHSYDKNPNPYSYTDANPDAIVYIPETGEILLGSNRYQALMATKDSETTPNVNEAEIRVTYDKSNWKKGDLRPEHYFYCQADKEDGSGDRTTYNGNYLTNGVEHQEIQYDVGYNQTIRINSTADECFKHGVGREVDDIVRAMQDVLDLEAVQKDIEGIMEKTTDKGELTTLQNQLDAVKKALTYAKEKEGKLFQSGITAFQKYHDDATLCVTNCGSRRSKLELIQNRTQNQKTTYETLKSENEDIDITEVAIQLNAAELTYNAALMASGKVMQTTLLNFI